MPVDPDFWPVLVFGGGFLLLRIGLYIYCWYFEPPPPPEGLEFHDEVDRGEYGPPAGW